MKIIVGFVAFFVSISTYANQSCLKMTRNLFIGSIEKSGFF